MSEAGGLNGSEDLGRIAARHPTENVGGREARVVEEIGDVMGRHAEFAEAVKEIGAVAGPRPAGNVEYVALWGDDGVEAGRGDGRRRLSQPSLHQAKNDEALGQQSRRKE